MKTIYILSVFLIIALCIIFFNNDHYKITYTENRKQYDSLNLLFRAKQINYEMLESKTDILSTELLQYKAAVKRSEDKLTELLKRERDAKKRNKEEIERYSNMQLDSAFGAMYPRPDSIYR